MAEYMLKRTLFDEHGTFGQLVDAQGKLICLTCEDVWRDNKPRESCIPKGTYACIPHDSEAHPNTWEVTGVPGRSAILIHSGNTERDTLGCILVGDAIGQVQGLPAVLNSRATMDRLRKILPSNFTLTIT